MTSSTFDSTERWEDKDVVTGDTFLQRRQTVIKFAKIPDQEPHAGKASIRKPTSTVAKREEVKTLKTCSINPSSNHTPEQNSSVSQNLSRLSVITKCEKEVKTSSTMKSEENNSLSARINYSRKLLQKNKTFTTESIKLVSPKKNDVTKSPNSSIKPPLKIKEIVNNSQSTQSENKKNSNENLKNKKVKTPDKSISSRIFVKPPVKPKSYKSVQAKVDTMIMNKMAKNLTTEKHTKYQKARLKKDSDNQNSSKSKDELNKINIKKVNSTITVNNNNIPKTSHNVRPQMKNQMTETSPDHDLFTQKKLNTREIEIQTEHFSETTFTELRVPNLSLNTENENNIIANNDVSNIDINDIPNLKLPPFKISPRGKFQQLDDQLSSNSTNTSIVIGKATVTYTRKKKINFQVVGTSDTDRSSISVSPSASLCIPSYPFTVMNILKRELNNSARSDKNIKGYDRQCLKDIYSWPDDIFGLQSKKFYRKKLVKPSDLIQKMQKKDFFLNSEYLCEQFQRELNFIDSFVESLQYLENNCVIERSSDTKRDYNCNGDASDLQTLKHNVKSESDSNHNNDKCNYRMTASRSLCLVNLLIREEQRRAKNLIFVLKMRECALKDFTISQIFYLEKKKRSDEEDVSTLKKKQRGALLKLQHECREMQRIKKALLALSEQRQNALMKTKRNIELKMSNGVELSRMFKCKKKYRNSNDANNLYGQLPFHDFDLSVSDISVDNNRSISNIEERDQNKNTHQYSVAIQSKESSKAEKSIQTCNNTLETVLLKEPTVLLDVVRVDGAYLNILFHNLDLPQMFTEGKDYEVNENAIQNILLSADRMHGTCIQEIVSVEENKSEKSLSKSSTPSTARSLVDEFDEYFNCLPKSESSSSSGKVDNATSEELETNMKISETESLPESSFTKIQENNPKNSQSMKNIQKEKSIVKENKDDIIKSKLDEVTTNKQQVAKMENMSKFKKDIFPETSNIIKFDNFIFSRHLSKVKKCDSSTNTDSHLIDKHIDGSEGIYIEASATAIPSSSSREILPVRKRENVIRTIESLKSTTSRPNKQDSSTCTSAPGGLDDIALRTKPVPTSAEEEELRKKQLAIELEIKALEQQFIVREIPDKPPPPYTPPTNETSTGTQTSAPPVDVLSTNERVVRAVNLYCDKLFPDVDDDALSIIRPADSLEELLLDFCVDSLKKMKVEKSDEPWHPSKLLPPKLSITKDKVVKALTEEAFQILGLCEQQPVNTGPPILSKKSDYLDDILFAEWRKCEVEWTCLEANEITVQNQLFNTIYDKLLEESIEEFKGVLALKKNKTN